MITFQFEGTSHGEGYRGTICGLPQGLSIDVEAVNKQLRLRKEGYGRSQRQKLADSVFFSSKTVGADGKTDFFVPNAMVENRGEITAVRSGHSDITGKARFPEKSVREIAEIASARNSVCYVVLGAICKQLLAARNVHTYHFVENIGGVVSQKMYEFGISEQEPHFSFLHCPCKEATKAMAEKINQAARVGDTLGGVVAVGATGVPMGVGEILPYSARLDAQIAANLVGIPSVKGISFGLGDRFAEIDGISAHDKLCVSQGIEYAENKCGGIVGGVSNGLDILCHLTVKPVPTVLGVETIDSCTLKPTVQHYERADTCVVPNVGVIAENILAYVIVNQMILQKLL